MDYNTTNPRARVLWSLSLLACLLPLVSLSLAILLCPHTHSRRNLSLSLLCFFFSSFVLFPHCCFPTDPTSGPASKEASSSPSFSRFFQLRESRRLILSTRAEGNKRLLLDGPFVVVPRSGLTHSPYSTIRYSVDIHIRVSSPDIARPTTHPGRVVNICSVFYFVAHDPSVAFSLFLLARPGHSRVRSCILAGLCGPRQQVSPGRKVKGISISKQEQQNRNPLRSQTGR